LSGEKRWTTVLAAAITVAAVAGLLAAFAPVRDTTYYARLQAKLIADANDVPDDPGQIHDMMKSTIEEFPDVTSLIIRSGNQVQFYHLLNDLVVFAFLPSGAQRSVIYHDIKNTLNRFVYTESMDILDSWNMTHGSQGK